ncbi:hypothetical protein G987_04349 [Escherichia coli UMEA 3687-1]|nr:hypothetical protein G987_04349 [Escherichia coli UMEA 3687-1]
MNLHEYQAKSLLAGMGMPCPKEIAIQQISQLADAWQHIACPSKGAVLKAQVHAGGRGKAGGVKVLKQLPEAQAFVQQMSTGDLSDRARRAVCQQYFAVRKHLSGTPGTLFWHGGGS